MRCRSRSVQHSLSRYLGNRLRDSSGVVYISSLTLYRMAPTPTPASPVSPIQRPVAEGSIIRPYSDRGRTERDRGLRPGHRTERDRGLRPGHRTERENRYAQCSCDVQYLLHLQSAVSQHLQYLWYRQYLQYLRYPRPQCCPIRPYPMARAGVFTFHHDREMPR